MTWLEMSRNEAHGGDGWGFTKCLWSPTEKDTINGGKWAFWENLLKVVEGDLIFHLRGKGKEASFVGYSVAETAGYRTNERPRELGEWEHAGSFYRVDLRDFTPFETAIRLQDVFHQQNAQLRQYFLENSTKHKLSKKSLFYVIQNERLQCLNGAYLSEIDDRLATLIISPAIQADINLSASSISEAVATGESIQSFWRRKGQQDFSNAVRDNYGGRCCFPGCKINDRAFLIGSHIARWSDVPDLRGQINNGLCLCLMHDKAFETGLFTINTDFKVVANKDRIQSGSWAEANIVPSDGQPISVCNIAPSTTAIRHHWSRIKFTPT